MTLVRKTLAFTCWRTTFTCMSIALAACGQPPRLPAPVLTLDGGPTLDASVELDASAAHDAAVLVDSGKSADATLADDASAHSDAAVLPARGWHVSDGHLRMPDGRAVILRGVNIANANKTAPYLGMDSAADWLRLRRDFGFNSVRFLMTWAAIEPVRGQYDDAYLDRVLERLAWAADAGLSVILDMHQDVYGVGFGFDGAPRWTCDEARYAAFTPHNPWFLNNVDPNVVACVDHFYQDADVQARFVAAWAHVAAHLHGASSVIGFDALNEPVWGTHLITTYERDLLQPLYERIIQAVRSEAPTWLAFLEPGASRNGGIATSLTQFDFPDVVYAPHSYDSLAESSLGFDDTRRAAVIDNVAKLRKEATTLGAALWVGEYGGTASSPGIAAYMDAEYDAFASVAASSMYWSYDRDDGYGLLNPDGTEKAVLADVLARPYPERVAGTPISWNWDESNSSFSFTYAPDSSLMLPTEIAVPARRYPNGYSVECGGCESERSEGVLRILHVPPGSQVTVTVTST